MPTSGQGKRGPLHARPKTADPIGAALRQFTSAVAATAGRGGEGEARLSGPLEQLVATAAAHIGVAAVPYGQVSLHHIRARPDYAVDVSGIRVGYVELKSPDLKALPPDWKPTRHDREQWEKLALLPNVIYTNGSKWRLFHYGAPAGAEVVLTGSKANGRELSPEVSRAFEGLMREFLLWEPESPPSLRWLISVMAGLCRILRDEVASILAAPPSQAREDLELLAADWRDLLFPDLDDARFSNSYAQTITFALLLAQINGVQVDVLPLHEIGRQLGKKHALIGRALAVLADSDVTAELSIIDTIRRVIATVDWDHLDDNHTDTYVELYERFLAEYDPGLRKESGTYYTPEPVARFMVNFVNDVLVNRLHVPWGMASDEVVIIDPAMGTGTFLVEVVRTVAEIVERKQGAGARPARLRELFKSRLVGFEKQVAPYAVTELRLHQALKSKFDTDVPTEDVRFLADTLEDPSVEALRFSAANKVIERARAEANRIKRDARVMVVIGNPPHLADAKGQAPWIEAPRKPGVEPGPSTSRPSLDEFRAPGLGAYESDLHGLHWYFWRWAMWKVFDAHPDQSFGVVAFITPSSFLTGRAFAGMRAYMRRTCDEGWLIDVSPELNRSNAETRLFPGVQRRLCVAVFARYDRDGHGEPAVIHHLAIEGTREVKIDRLRHLRPDDSEWMPCTSGSRDALLPQGDALWRSMPTLGDLMPWGSRGVTPGRGWIYAPDPLVLRRRWENLMIASPKERAILFKEGRDRRLTTAPRALPGFESSQDSVATHSGECLDPIRVGYRSFDREWIIPDGRLMEMPREPLWAVRSDRQVYVTEQNAVEIQSGPALTFTSLIPDMNHFNGRAGRVIPLFRDQLGNESNVTPQLLRFIGQDLDAAVTGDDFLAYVACVVAHSSYTERFSECLREPGVRIPITGEVLLWKEAVALGNEVIWLHTYGDRGQSRLGRDFATFVDDQGPRVRIAIPDEPDRMPAAFSYESVTQTLRIGEGAVGPVSDAVMKFAVGGYPVVNKWVDRRLRQPRFRRKTSPLDDINCERWTPQLTDELLKLLAVLDGIVRVAPQQAVLLERILDGPLITQHMLLENHVLPTPDYSRKAPRWQRTSQDELL